MLDGRIDEFGRALLFVSIRATQIAAGQSLEVWVDTGFTGDLVVSKELVLQLGLPQSAMVAAALADGSKSILETFSCVVDWFGESREFEVIASEGRIPLIGVGLLLGHRLFVDYDQLTLTID